MLPPAHFVDQRTLGDVGRREFFSEMGVPIHPEMGNASKLLQVFVEVDEFSRQAAHEVGSPCLAENEGSRNCST